MHCFNTSPFTKYDRSRRFFKKPRRVPGKTSHCLLRRRNARSFYRERRFERHSYVYQASPSYSTAPVRGYSFVCTSCRTRCRASAYSPDLVSIAESPQPRSDRRVHRASCDRYSPRHSSSRASSRAPRSRLLRVPTPRPSHPVRPPRIRRSPRTPRTRRHPAPTVLARPPPRSNTVRPRSIPRRRLLRRPSLRIPTAPRFARCSPRASPTPRPPPPSCTRRGRAS